MLQKVKIPRLVVGAPQGRSGKTTFTVGLLAGLIGKNLRVQSFKKGPDFIDPSWHARITGRLCRNLDRFLMDEDTIKSSLAKGTAGADIALIEGAMGLFDGVDLEGSNSTAEIAKITGTPVVLVINTTRMTRSVAAIVKGCMELDPEVKISAVILNNVARPRHENMLRSAIEYYCGIPVLGAIPRGKQFNIPDRHLGLVPASEDSELAEKIDLLGKEAGQYLDLNGLINAAGQARDLSVFERLDGNTPAIKQWNINNLDAGSSCAVKLGICVDRAFSFYYPENLEALQTAGASLVAIDSINDTELPEIDGLYIGGGFPELFIKELGNNTALKQQILAAIEDGLPVYAECGGLMYLGKSISWDGKKYCMVGALPFDVEMQEKPLGHGYITCQVKEENPYFPVGTTIKGHEFHHSRTINMESSLQQAWEVTRGHGIDGQVDGFVYKNVLACYTHLHALGTPCWAPALVHKAKEYKEQR
ncbi:MAG: hydrogenobyrinic acid a,c-diamide synthase (glutamine-hydrolyzing) [Clostridiales bacterium]|nr:hydrogenobyrinic acid a,c-diamide synthase (glutamine-hydrolyzing) [Clostridiales bacterium]MCF8022516.1 hydrogenobyrinic acid a,c-diamide synthase (glutamine-hydrolyzing) [Clostridiales bacterium]